MEIKFLRQAHKFIKNAKGNLKITIQIEVDKIIANPSIGEPLDTPLKGIKARHFTYDRVSYRIAFRKKNNLLFIMIASRENFYKDLTKYVSKTDLNIYNA